MGYNASMRTDAIILDVRPWRERDLFVRCYTEQAGVASAVARGALGNASVQGMHLGQGNLVRFELVSAKGVPIMTGAVAVRSFSRIRENLVRQAAALSIAEGVLALATAPERDERLWAVLVRSFGALDACAERDVLSVLRGAQREMLGAFGYAPRTDTCGVCGSSPGKTVVFSVELGSIVCTSCAHSGWYGVALTDRGRRWLGGEALAFPDGSRAERGPTEFLMEYVTGRRLRSLDLLFGALKT